LQEEEPNYPVAGIAITGESPGGNEALQEKYEEMHSIGPKAWFGDGKEERELILKMGQPWTGKTVLEIGCGEGDLCGLMVEQGARVAGVDYSSVAIEKAAQKYPLVDFVAKPYREVGGKGVRLVMQGVLEHFDDPWGELKWIFDNLVEEHGDVITSSPAFVNPRGFVWMALDALGAVMTKTDLHFLNPWDFEEFCKLHHYHLEWRSCDFDWANGQKMVDDLTQRIPLALKDGGIRAETKNLAVLLDWLKMAAKYQPLAMGATAVYRISK